MDEHFMQQMIRLFDVSYNVYFFEEAFTSFPRMVRMCAKVGADMHESYRSDNACRRFLPFIYEHIRQPLLEQLQQARYISILIDGATDTAVMELELVYARVWTQDGPKNMYVSIEDIKNANAEGVLTAVENAFDGVGMETWKDKLIAFGADGASVNMGCRSGVGALLKAQQPHLVSIHCMAHRLELVFLKANKDNRHLEKIQEVLIHIYKQYHNSPKALREFRAIAEALEEKGLKPTNLGGTRWIPHISRALQVAFDKNK